MLKSLNIQGNGAVLVNGAELDVESWTRRSTNIGSDSPSISAREYFANSVEHKSLRHLVIGIIGPRAATHEQITTAYSIANALGGLGLTLICGGKSGVMEAASRGCRDAGGLMIGILPGSTPGEANPYVGIALPTGLNEARNMVIANSARVLIAVGESYGTLSEVAYGLHFSKPVIGVEGAANVEGVVHADSADAAVNLALEALLLSAKLKDSNTGRDTIPSDSS